MQPWRPAAVYVQARRPAAVCVQLLVPCFALLVGSEVDDERYEHDDDDDDDVREEDEEQQFALAARVRVARRRHASVVLVVSLDVVHPRHLAALRVLPRSCVTCVYVRRPCSDEPANGSSLFFFLWGVSVSTFDGSVGVSYEMLERCVVPWQLADQQVIAIISLFVKDFIGASKDSL